MKILIVDDHVLFREGLALALACMHDDGEDHDVPIIMHADHAQAALAVAAQHSDLTLMLLDLDLPDMNGIQALKQFRNMDVACPVVMISASHSAADILTAIDAGASGFIPKDLPTEVLLSALRLVLAGGIYLPPQAVSLMRTDQHQTDLLTPRQLEVLQYLHEGSSNKVIAYALGLSESTVKVHIRHIFTALNAKNRSHATSIAMHLGVL